jgi:hypothetical protein
VTTPSPEGLDPLDRMVEQLATTNWRDLGRRLRAGIERDHRGGDVDADGYPTGAGGPGPTNQVGRPVESAVLRQYRTAREDPNARVCPKGCNAPFEQFTEDDIEQGAPLEPGTYCSACWSLTVLRDADGPQGAGVFVTAKDPVRQIVTTAWKILQRIADDHQTIVGQLDQLDELGHGSLSTSTCEPCERAGRLAPMSVYSDVGGRLDRAERLCLWHYKWLWRRNRKKADRAPDEGPVYPADAEVHRHHATTTRRPARARTQPKPADPKADIAERRHKRMTVPATTKKEQRP